MQLQDWAVALLLFNFAGSTVAAESRRDHGMVLSLIGRARKQESVFSADDSYDPSVLYGWPEIEIPDSERGRSGGRRRPSFSSDDPCKASPKVCAGACAELDYFQRAMELMKRYERSYSAARGNTYHLAKAIPKRYTLDSNKIHHDACVVYMHKFKLPADPRPQPKHLKIDYSHLESCKSCFENEYLKSTVGADITELVGLNKQLLVDDWVVAGWKNMARQHGPVEVETEPVLRADAERLGENQCPQDCESLPFSGQVAQCRLGNCNFFGFYGSTLHDGENFRMYLKSSMTKYMLATSPDGVQWSRPEQAVVRGLNMERKGSSKQEEAYVENLCIKYDPSTKQFLAGFSCAHTYEDGTKESANVCLAKSDDGQHFEPLYEQSSPVGRAGDTCIGFDFDATSQKHTLTFRGEFAQRRGGWRQIRGVQLAESADISNSSTWQTTSKFYLDRQGKEEQYRRQLYQLGLNREAGMLMGTASVYHFPKAKTYTPKNNHDVLDIYFTSSRDGRTFDLDWIYTDQPMVPRPNDASDFPHGHDQGMRLPTGQFVSTEKEHLIFYEARNAGHENRWSKPATIGLARVPHSRFVAVSPADSSRAGVVVTKPFKFEGQSIELDVAAKGPNSIIRMSVLDGAANHKSLGSPVELQGFNFQQFCTISQIDSGRVRAKWHEKNLADLKGKMVQLKFTMRESQLFGFQVTDDATERTSCKVHTFESPTTSLSD